MSLPPSLVERAHQMAESGGYASISGIKVRLRREGYPNPEAHFTGAMLSNALAKLCRTSRTGEATVRAERSAQKRQHERDQHRSA